METILLFAPLVGALIAGFGHGVIGTSDAALTVLRLNISIASKSISSSAISEEKTGSSIRGLPSLIAF